MQLNEQQQQAITHVDTPLLVIAGAGSGKTRVITQKIIYLITQVKIIPQNVYAVTFTNKAAKEMQARIKDYFKTSLANSNKRAPKVNISTFHTLGLKILREDGAAIGLEKNFSLFDPQDSLQLLRELSKDLVKLNDESLKLVRSLISKWKNDLIFADLSWLKKNFDILFNDLNFSIDEKIANLAIDFYVEYQASLNVYNAVDFDDLILRPYEILIKNPDILAKWQSKIQYLLVDEYQDTNNCQYQLIKAICDKKQKFTVVGDDDQSVYTWRGAKPENIKLLSEDFPSLQVVKLEQNYRSTTNILDAANSVISNNPHIFPKQLWSDIYGGEKLKIIGLEEAQDEAQRVVSEIISLKYRFNLKYNNFAILYRSNYQSRPFEQVLREQNIMYQISGGTSFFAYKEVKDLMAYFKLMLNPDDDMAYLRCVNTPSREIGPKTIQALKEYAKSRNQGMLLSSMELGFKSCVQEKYYNNLQNFADLILKTAYQSKDNPVLIIKEFIEKINYLAYLEVGAKTPSAFERQQANVISLLDWLEKLTDDTKGQGLSLKEAIQKMLIIDMLDRENTEQSDECVQLLTMHAAKGLEFPYVYIVGMNDGVLPHKNHLTDLGIIEERRLFYVALTRAQKVLTLTFPKKEKRYNEYIVNKPSRFLEELPDDLLEYEGVQDKERVLSPEEELAKGQSHLANIRALLEN